MARPGVAINPPEAPGAADYRRLQASGMPQDKIDEWQAEINQKFVLAGMPPKEQAAYWGEAQPGSAKFQQIVQNNVQRHGQPGGTEAHGFLENLAAGWDMSVAGLIRNGKAPTRTPTSNPGIMESIAQGAGQLAGDLPSAIVGGVAGAAAGGAAGAAVPGAGETGASEAVGAVVGAGFFGSAVPEGMRQGILMAYRRGEYVTMDDAFKDAVKAATKTAKAGVVGAASNLIGGKIGGIALKATEQQVFAHGANLAAQVATATTVGAGLEGRTPDKRDFISGAVLALGVHGGTVVAGKVIPSRAALRMQNNLEEIYERTGVPPWEAMDRARTDPMFRQEVYAQDINGNPVIPKFRAAAGIEPEPYQRPVQSIPDPISKPGGEHGPAPKVNLERFSAPKIYEGGRLNSSAEFFPLMRALEGSGDNAVSPVGAIGRHQIMPGTARQYMGNNFDVKTLFDPKVNQHVAEVIVNDLFKRYNGDINAMLIAYNAGPGRAAKYMRVGSGTMLEAIPDKAARNGIRYEERPSARDESWLPAETQKYLANGRRRSSGGTGGGGGNGVGGGGGGSGGGRDEFFAPVPQEGAGGGGGGEPPGGNGTAAAPFGKRPNDTFTTEEAYNEIGKIIGEPPKPPSLLKPDTILDQWFSELTPARRIDDRLIKAGEYNRDKTMGVEDMFRQTYASTTRAGAFVRFGVVDALTLDIKEGSKSIMDAVKSVRENGGDLQNWTRYMLALRTAVKAEAGVDTGISLKAAHAVLMDKGELAKYKEATRTFNEVMDGALEYSRDSGVHSQEQVDAMIRENPAYISMRRVMGDDAGFNGGRGFATRDALRNMEGSDRKIIDPIQASIDNIHMLVKMADRNRAIGAVVALAESGKLKDLGIRRSENTALATISESAGKELAPYGLAPESESAFSSLLAERATKGFGPNQFLFFRNGKAEVWEATDPQLVELLRKADSPGQANIVLRTFEFAASMERAGIVGMLDFPLRATLRDQISTGIFDPLHPAPFYTLARGIVDMIGGGKMYKRAVAKGALGAAMVDMDATWIKRDMHAIMSKTGVWEATWNTVKHPLELMQIINEKLDAANRVGYMIAAEKKGIEPVKAATMSRKAYLDFAERGTAAVANGLSKTIPFFRPNMLGLKQMGEAVAQRPVSTLAYAAAAITMPSIALYALNYLQDQVLPEDRKYKNLPRWQRDTYFITPEINGTRFRMRYPYNAGFIMGGMMNRVMDAMWQHDPHAFEEWAKGFLNDYLPPMFPALTQAPIEIAANHSFFTGHPLIPASMERASGYLQYTENTTEPAKELARVLGPAGYKMLDVSPIEIEHLVKGWAGPGGMLALKAINIPFKKPGPPMEIGDIPFVQSFVVRNPKMNAQPIEDFYKALKGVETAHADFGLAMKRAQAGTGDLDMRDLDMTGKDARAFVNLGQTSKAIQMSHVLLQGVYGDKTMTTAEKRQFIEQTYTDIILASKMGLKTIDSIKEVDTDKAFTTEAVPAPVDNPNIVR